MRAHGCRRTLKAQIRFQAPILDAAVFEPNGGPAVVNKLRITRAVACSGLLLHVGLF